MDRAPVAMTTRRTVEWSVGVPSDEQPEELIAAARRGDRGAQGRLLTSCKERVTRLVVRMTRDPSIAEDLVQETFSQGPPRPGALSRGFTIFDMVVRDRAQRHAELARS